MNYISIFSSTIAALLACAGSLRDVQAQSAFPQREITIIVSAAPGGASDMTARIIAKGMESELHKPVIVLNKPGGSGGVGMSTVARSASDGYTLGLMPVELVMHQPLKLSTLDPNAFDCIAQTNVLPSAVTVPADAPYNTIGEFIKYAQANPGKVRVGNAGAGSIWHITASALEANQKVSFNHIPFEGAAPAVTALLGKHIEAVTVNAGEVKAGVEAGKLKILAIMTPERDPAFPKVPTLIESGVNLDLGGWSLIAAPKGTPAPVLETLGAAVKKAANSEEFKNFMTSRGMIVKYRNSTECKQFVGDQFQFFNKFLSTLELGK